MWIIHKWEIRRGFVKLHVMVDVDTKKILAVQVTDYRAGDSPMPVPPFDEALEAVMRTCQAQDSGGACRCGVLPVRGCRICIQR